MKLQLKNCLKNRVDFYHTFYPGNHRDGNEYLSTQKYIQFEKLHSLKEEHCECVVTALCFGTGAAPSVLLKVAVLCVVAALLPALECSLSLEVAMCFLATLWYFMS